MKKTLCLGWMVLALCNAEVLRAEETNKVQFAAISQATNLQELAVLEVELNARTGDVSTELYQVLSRIRSTKERVMKQDEELRALNQKIAELQREIDVLLVKKCSELTPWEAERDKLMNEHEKIRKAVLAIRKRKFELMTPSAQPGDASPVAEENESETEMENKE